MRNQSREKFIDEWLSQMPDKCIECINLTYDGPGCACWCKEHAPTILSGPIKDINHNGGVFYSPYGGYYKI